jgi:hypothetical protein
MVVSEGVLDSRLLLSSEPVQAFFVRSSGLVLAGGRLADDRKRSDLSERCTLHYRGCVHRKNSRQTRGEGRQLKDGVMYV